MEDKNYKYIVAVKCDQSPETLQKLKNKVHTYFQSKHRSAGGECEIRDTDCSRGHFLIYFKEKEAQLRVLQKTSHELVISDQTKFKFEIFLPEETMGAFPSSQHNDEGASGSSVGTDHQQEHSWNGNKESQTDFSSRDKESGSTRHNQWDNESGNSRTFGGAASWAGNESKVPADSDTSRTGARGNSLSHMSIEDRVERGTRDLPEIFTKVTGRLSTELFHKKLQTDIRAEIPSLNITESREYVEVSGTFGEINRVHHLLLGKLGLNAENPSDTRSSGTAGNAESFSATDNQKLQVCLSSALYEYIMEVQRSEVEVIKRRNRVKIDHRSSPDGTTYVTITPLAPESLPEDAKETFTDMVQKVMGDWSQEKVDPSVVPLKFSDIKQRLKDNCRNILVIQEGNMDIILRGPRDELSQAIQFLKKDYKPARPRGAPTISSGDIRTEVPVDVRHMDILKKLKSREISDIEKKYNVKMDERRKNGSVLVTFRSIDVTPDLSPHASHSFTALLQKTFFNIEKKEMSVNPEFQEERVAMLQEELLMRGVDIVMEYSGGSVFFIGHPVHVAFAMELFSGSQNPGRGQAAASSEEPMDTNDTSANHQPKAEEPDTCPVCLCEIQAEDKVTLEKCKHAYCRDCLKNLMAHKPMCAICGVAYGTIKGDQPDGTMTHTTHRYPLPGYSACGTIEIHYNIPGGTQQANHPHPGKHFHGAYRTAFLPDNTEGRDILRLLRKAFDQRLTFTVGESRTTGATDTVTWNDIHHKTSTSGGPQSFGYPDPDYLKRVRDELKAKGIE